MQDISRLRLRKITSFHLITFTKTSQFSNDQIFSKFQLAEIIFTKTVLVDLSIFSLCKNKFRKLINRKNMMIRIAPGLMNVQGMNTIYDEKYTHIWSDSLWVMLTDNDSS